jgi:c-di-GMP-binding flagellar brake protein YcgR
MAEQDKEPLSERRKFARLRKEFLVRVVNAADRPSASPTAEATVANISLGGIALETDEAYPMRSVLSLETLLPEQEAREAVLGPADSSEGLTLLRAECEVIWCNPAGNGRFSIGLRFLNLDEEQFKALSRLLARDSQ